MGSYDNKHSLKYTGKRYFFTERTEYIVSLSKGLENINTSKRFRRNVKKGEKINPQITDSSEIDKTSILLDLLSSTKKVRINKYDISYNPFYLTNLNENTLKKLLASGLAHLRYTTTNDSVDCMEFNLEKASSVYMLLKGTNENGYKNGLSSYLSYNLTKSYVKKGYSFYNQGGRPFGSDGDGLTVYKKSMGAEEITVYGATTNFLTYPHKLLNPILNIGRKLPKDNQIVKFLKRFI